MLLDFMKKLRKLRCKDLVMKNYASITNRRKYIRYK